MGRGPEPWERREEGVKTLIFLKSVPSLDNKGGTPRKKCHVKEARGGQSVPTTKLSLCLPPSLSRTKGPKSLWFEWERKGVGAGSTSSSELYEFKGFLGGAHSTLVMAANFSKKNSNHLTLIFLACIGLEIFCGSEAEHLKNEPIILCNFGPHGEILYIYFQNAVGPFNFSTLVILRLITGDSTYPKTFWTI